jgi:hypothetical protein
VLRGGPFHGEQLLVRFQKVRCRELGDGITGCGKSEYRGARFEEVPKRGKSGFPIWEVGVSGVKQTGDGAGKRSGGGEKLAFCRLAARATRRVSGRKISFGDVPQHIDEGAIEEYR